MERGVNLPPYGYYHQPPPFIDHLRAVGPPGPIVLNPGQTLALALHVPPYQDWGRSVSAMKTGEYVATWNTPLEVRIVPWEVPARDCVPVREKIGPRRYVARVTTPNTRVAVLVRNSTNERIEEQQLRVHHSEDEPALLAGALFRAGYVNALKGMRWLRVMDLLHTYSFGYARSDDALIEPADWRRETDIYSWGGVVEGGKQGPPIEVLAKLAEQVGAGLQIDCGKWSRATMRALAERIANSGFSGPVALAPPNEAWNYAAAYWKQWDWLRRHKSRGLPTANDRGAPTPAAQGGNALAAGTAQITCELWHEFSQVFPRNRLRFVFAGQLFLIQALSAAMWYVNPFTGRRLADEIDEYQVAPYMTLQPSAEIPDTRLAALCAQRAYELPESVWLRSAVNSLGELHRTMKANFEWLKGFGRPIPLGCYELGFDSNNLALEQRQVHGEALAGTLAVPSGERLFMNGERIFFPYGGAPKGLPERRALPVTVGSRGISVYATQADYETGRTFAIPDGRYPVDAFDRALAVNAWHRRCLDGAAGGELYAAMYNRILKPYASGAVLHFTAWGADMEGQYWGLAPNEWTETPRRTFWRTLE